MDKILVIDDEQDVQYAFRRIFDSPEVEITSASSGEEALSLFPTVNPNLVIMDVRMGGINGMEALQKIKQLDARTPIIMMTAYGTTQTAIEAMKLGAHDYLLKPFDVPKLQQLVFSALKASRDMQTAIALELPAEGEDDGLGIIGRSEDMQKVFKSIGQLARSNATALITGESGTGKELVAKAIYQHSQRGDHPFLAINCAAIPDNLLESELFGHEKGAFTGANSLRIGKFEQCHQGTLFLDEIGDMPMATQSKILRVLQSGTFERVGGNQTLKVDVRVIAATNKKLEQAISQGEFREDLFYRLNVFRIHLPSLHERRTDIKLLVAYFLRKYCLRFGFKEKSITPEALAALESYSWPGNVRELENVIQRAIVVSQGDALIPSDLPSEIVSNISNAHAASAQSAAPATPHSGELDIPELATLLFQWARTQKNLKIIPAVERELVRHALQETNGNQVQAAALLGITRATLRKRIEKFNIQQELAIK